ncbi:MAG TPA: hypothetical protein VFV87_02320, partial [Pirellulaceae bacterium]|nr:hypothetical protein [Pirellulaceae bacterium]
GRLLGDLYEARANADYKLNDPKAIRNARDVNFVEDQIKWANDVKSILVQCNVEPIRSAVKAGIEADRQRMASRKPGGT